MREKGSMKQILTKYEVQGQVCPDLSGKPLDFGAVFSAFVILLAGVVFGALLFCLELITVALGLDVPFLHMYGVGDTPYVEPTDFIKILKVKDDQLESMQNKILQLEQRLQIRNKNHF